jgi:carboxyl-terminal processing protease
MAEKRGGVTVSTELSNGIDPLNGIPTVVLVNEGSASASEITAGALKDNKAATIIGVKTFGKGSVQELQPLTGGTELKITIARWYRPNGQNIDKKGISPDQEVKMTSEDYTAGKDPQKDAAINALKKPQ